MDAAAAHHYLATLLHDIAWRHDEAILFGRHMITRRVVAWYGDRPFRYTYSNTTKEALGWTPALLELKNITEQHTGTVFNSCLLNRYHDGSEGMAWHSDDETSLGRNTSIASLSFGAERKFAFRHKQSRETVALVLEHGSLLEMKGSTQQHWQHQLPLSRRITTPRINLTFRTIIGQ